MNTPVASPPSVLILGANGRLGCALARAFHAAGWSALAQVRPEASPLLPPKVILLRVPISDVDALANAARSVTVVIHAVNPAYTRWSTEALPALRAGLEVAQRTNAHFMLPGNIHNFGASMPPLLSEDTPARASTEKGCDPSGDGETQGRAGNAGRLPCQRRQGRRLLWHGHGKLFGSCHPEVIAGRQARLPWANGRSPRLGLFA
jgi:hypothetical protein